MDFWVSEMHTNNVKISIRAERQLFSAQSEFQRLDIFETPEFGKVLTSNGNVIFTEKDEFIYDEMIVHVPMAVHPHVEKVLVIGAGDGGVIRELVQYSDLQHIDMVEVDPLVVEVCKKYLPKTACRLDDPRLTIHYEDGLKFIRSRQEEYDLIIVDSTDPFGPGEGLFTREFYGNCYKALKEDGILINQHESPFYPGDAAACQRAHKTLWRASPSARCTRPTSPPTPRGTGCLGLPAKSTTPCGTWTRPGGTCGAFPATTTPPPCTRGPFISQPMWRSC